MPVKAELFQEKHLLSIEKSTDPKASRLVSLTQNHAGEEGNTIGYFEDDKKNGFAVHLPPSYRIGPHLLGDTFKLTTLDKYYLHDITPKTEKTSDAPEELYTLYALLGNSKAVFSKNGRKIHVYLGAYTLSSSQMGNQFHLGLDRLYQSPWVVSNESS